MKAFLVRFTLELAVFVGGALVMVYEIIGSRIVSPYIGTSTYVWTSLIGVILAALSLGYWLGGRMADKRPDVKVLASAIFLAGGAVSLTILIKDAVLSMIHAAGGPLELKSVVAAALLFAPASVLLGFVTPYAVKLRTLSLADSGKTVGRLYALSTVGSIAGTFAAGFFLIPFVGSTRTLYLIAGLLFAVSILLVPITFTRANLMILTLFALGVAGSEFSSYHMRQTRGLIDLDTEYSRVQVYETTDKETGRPFRAIATDPYFAQSAMYLDDGSPVFEYVPFFHLVRHFKPNHQNVLMIGGAGYTIPREHLKTYPQASMDVVEIDPQMTQIARRYFNLSDYTRLRIFHEDGRVFLNRSEPTNYDAVFVDAFGSLFSIPYQLTTVEAVREIHRVLTDGGIVIVNIGSAISGPASHFLQAELATYRTVFPKVHLFKVRPERRDDELQNVILVAVNSPLSGGELAAASADGVVGGDRILSPPRRGDAENTEQVNGIDSLSVFDGAVVTDDQLITSLLSRQYRTELPLNLPPLTDDLAPVEHYNSIALSHQR